MPTSKFLLPFPWTRYSKKITSRIENPRNAGFLREEEAATKNMRLVLGKEGHVELGCALILYLLIDEEDGVVADAKFQAFGSSALIAAADAACDLLLHKNYEQARRLTADLIDTYLRDKTTEPAFPPETSSNLNLVIDAIEDAADQCLDIPFNEIPPYSPVVSPTEGMETREYPGWHTLSAAQKIQVIEEVLAKEVQPYVALDAGGVRVLNLLGNEVLIAYEGSCTTCYSATGSTLYAIQQILRTRVHPELIVTPDLSSLQGQDP